MAILFGLILFAVAAWFGFWLERKKFYRRNSAGIEQFESYGNMMRIKIKEGSMKAVAVLVGLAGVICIFAGLIAMSK